eukprot:TRINITY_DN23568_c0_g1_i1.p3 TRINITY_DN23568_c0_g1~~TRINITY_DN23568_c0_g1_i1.p3  ORF type:complete len:108 (-),score=12.03 TRINITY_DN23568_c0_g1_i1:63-386(-)
MVDLAKAIALIGGIEDAIFDKFLQPILQRIFDHAVNSHAAIVARKRSSFEVPQLTTKLLFRLQLVVNTTQSLDTRLLHIKLPALQRAATIRRYLSKRLFGIMLFTGM